MSDGPHRSLPMRRWWKRLAERADKCAFTAYEVAEALVPALEAECRSEMTSAFRDRLRREAAEPTLFGPQLTMVDEQAATGFERRVLGHLAVLSPAESSDGSAIQTALENALRGEALRYSRQIEEHYLREAPPHRAQNVRDRLNEALGRSNVRAIGEKLLRLKNSDRTARVSIKSGLDDGVKLR